MDNITVPLVIANESDVAVDGSIFAFDMFDVFDPDEGHFISNYEVNDFGPDGGRFFLNGLTLESGVWHSIAPNQIASLRYLADDQISSETFGVRVTDSAGQVSDPSFALVNSLLADSVTPPTVTAIPTARPVNSSLSLLDMIRVDDADPGATVRTYQIRDNSVNGGSFLLNDEVLAANLWHDVAAGGQIAALEFRTSSEFFIETFSVRVIDSSGNISNTATSTVTSGNSSSVITATDGRVVPLQFASIRDFFSVTDIDGDTPETIGILDRNNNIGGGHFQVRGQDLPQAQWAFYPWEELDDILYQGAENAESEVISLLINDGFSLSEEVSFTITTSARPVIEETDLTIFENEVLPAGAFFNFVDADGDLPVAYSVIDRRLNEDGGHFLLNGVRQESGRWFSVSALEFNSLQYVGASEGPDGENIAFHVFDTGGQWSAVTDIIVETKAFPEVRATDVSIKRDQYINVATGGIANVSGAQAPGTPFIDFADANGDPVEQLMFIDRQLNTNGGHFLLNGVRLPSATHFTITPAELPNLEYRAGLFGPQTENLSVFSFANGRWSAREDFQIFTLQNEYRPEVNLFNGSARLGTITELSAQFDWIDRDGDLPVSFSIFDTGATAQSGFFTDNGVVLAAQEWHTFEWSRLEDIRYQYGSVGSSEVIRILLNDGRSVSTIASATLNSVDAPEIVAASDFQSIDSIERIAASSLINQTDSGPAFTQYEIYDENTALRSGRFELNGVDLQQGVLHTLTAAEFGNLVFKGAEADFGRQLDPVLIRATNGITGYTEWERININTDPVGSASLVSGSQWTDAANLGRTVITYTFIDGDPDNFSGPSPPLPTYYNCPGDAQCNQPNALNPSQRESIRETLGTFERFTNLEFREVAFTADAADATFIFALADLPAGVLGQAFFPTGDVTTGQGAVGGDVFFDVQSFNPDTSFDTGPGTDFKFVSLHEIGHALGLAHSFQTPALPNASDFQYNTVLSQTRDSVNNPLRDLAHPELPSSVQLYDIIELQRLYGVNTTFNDGNNHYGNFLSGSDPHFFDNETSHQTTLYDAGGFDTYNYTSHIADETIDLRQGTWSSINGVPLSLRTAYLSVIENARGGSGNDTIRGNEIENLIFGNAGDDLLRGGGANDVLRGGDGNDTYVWQTGDGRDLIQEQSSGGIDVLSVLDPSGAVDSLEDDLIFRRLGNDLRIDLTYNQGVAQGTVTIVNFEDPGSQVEVLRIHDAVGNQIGGDIDLISIYEQATVVHTRFQVTANENVFDGYTAFAASPA